MDDLLPTEKEKIPHGRLNNAEYAYLSGRLLEHAEIAGAAALGVTDEFIAALKANVEKLLAIHSSSYASEQTPLLNELDKKRDDLLVYLLADIRLATKSPRSGQQAAAESLLLTTKPYAGIQRLALNQKTADIFSLKKHLEESPALEHLTTLGLTSVLSELVGVNEEYERVTKLRIVESIENDLGSCHEVRLVTDEQIDYLCTMGLSASLINKSSEAVRFVENMNALIRQCRTANNQRLAQHKTNNVEKGISE